MKVLKILLAVTITGLMAFLSLSCNGNATATATPKPQIATVQRGNISIIVTGTGNLALKNKQELSFGQTGLVSQASYAKISDVLVTEGAIVEQGQVLVKADTKDWQDQIVSDQHSLDSAKYSLSQAKSAVFDAQAALLKARDNVIDAQVSVTKAQNNVAIAENDLVTAKYNLSMQSDVKELQDKIDNANIQLQQAKVLLKEANNRQDADSARYWKTMIQYYSEDTNPESTNVKRDPDGGLIGQYATQMNVLVNDPEHANVTSSVADIKSRVAAEKQAENNLPIVQAGVASAQNNVAYAQNAVLAAQNDLELAQNSIVIAQNKVDDAQKNMDNDKNSSQEIFTPFKGLITKVDVNKGDIVQRSANLIEIAEPDKFIAKVMVTERDIMSVKIGGNASVSFDALSGLSFPAQITQVAPLATVQSGVVNYTVTVELTSLKPVASQITFGASGFSGGGFPSGTPPAGFSPPAGFTPPAGAGFQGPSGSSAGSAAAVSITPANINLKDGLSATVTIPVQEKNNVIVVASRAITRKAGGVSTVQVVVGTSSEPRTVKTGLSDSTNTEITEGLKEGEQILIQVTSSSSSGFPRGPFPF